MTATELRRQDEAAALDAAMDATVALMDAGDRLDDLERSAVLRQIDAAVEDLDEARRRLADVREHVRAMSGTVDGWLAKERPAPERTAPGLRGKEDGATTPVRIVRNSGAERKGALVYVGRAGDYRRVVAPMLRRLGRMRVVDWGSR